MVGRRTVVTVLAACAALLGAAWPARAGSLPAAPGATGHDVSYPQCAGSGTTVGSLGGQFGLVGVTDGRPWSVSPCEGAEYAWASGRPGQPGLYLNTANPAPSSSFFWPTSGSSSPVLCRNSASTTDPGCAYDYGWHAAANALATAKGVTPAAASLPWWMDVERANSWNGDGSANAADLQGVVDYLRGSGVPAVGVYSSAGDWSAITGGYSIGTAAGYQAAWAAEFTPRYPLSQSPVWVAGAGTSVTAASTCAAPGFTGLVPQLAQYLDGSGYDADLVCGAPATPSVSVSLSPASARVKRGGSLAVTVAVSEQGTAQAVTLGATSTPTGPALTVVPVALPGPGTARLTIAVPGTLAAGSYTVAVTASGATAAGSGRLTLKVR